eukprot:809181-Amphidinium_carterae.1
MAGGWHPPSNWVHPTAWVGSLEPRAQAAVLRITAPCEHLRPSDLSSRRLHPMNNLLLFREQKKH